MSTPISQFNAQSLSQYLKYISFKKFNFNKIEPGNSVDVNLSVDTKALGPNGTYEVSLVLSVTCTKADGSKVFSLDAEYAGSFRIFSTEGVEREIMLMVYCPTILFPFLRRVVSDITSEAGLQPLLLSTVDFSELYEQRQGLQ